MTELDLTDFAARFRSVTPRRRVFLRLRCLGLPRAMVAREARVTDFAVRAALNAAFQTLGVRGQHAMPEFCYQLGRLDERERAGMGA